MLPAIEIGREGDARADLLLSLANRHGLITGATGTGKTVTLRLLAEGFSRAGVPVFMVDAKGDLSGLGEVGGDHPKLAERAKLLQVADYAGEGFPVTFWDVHGERGLPLRLTISELGPMLLARLLDLNAVQTGVLHVAFRLADEHGYLLIDLKDLRAILAHCSENSGEISRKYGSVAPSSVAAIQRSILALESEGGDTFFGEPALRFADLFRTDERGRGVLNLLAAERLMNSPKIYSSLLLWILSELFEQLPEVGDPAKPKLVLFFDEAHLLFDDAPDALLDKIEQVVRLIRSKGVGVYFITQNPADVPGTVLSQLSNRIQHALRAYTPRELKAVKTAAATFRANPKFDTEEVISRLSVGEALVSCLDEKGIPLPVERILVLPPRSRMEPISDAARSTQIRSSVLHPQYDKTIDRESAYEMLEKRRSADLAANENEAEKAPASGGSRRQSAWEAFVKSTLRSIGSQIGRMVMRGVLGSISKGGR